MKTFGGLTLSFFKLNFAFLQFPMKTIPQVQSHDCQGKNKVIKWTQKITGFFIRKNSDIIHSEPCLKLWGFWLEPWVTRGIRVRSTFFFGSILLVLIPFPTGNDCQIYFFRYSGQICMKFLAIWIFGKCSRFDPPFKGLCVDCFDRHHTLTRPPPTWEYMWILGHHQGHLIMAKICENHEIHQADFPLFGG